MFSFCNHRAVNNKIMRAYDYEEDKESNEEPEIKEVQLQQFDDDFHFSKITAEVHEINYQLKAHDSSLKKMQRQIDAKVTESQLTETIALINAGIHTDPNMIKLLKTKEGLNEEQSNKVKMNASLFARKLNQMSESISVLLGGLKRLESKITSVEDDLSMQFNEKSNTIQLQLEQVRGETNKESMQLQQKMQLLSYQLNDKMRDIDTKVNWKLTEFKSKIDDKINEEMVLIYLQNMEKKMDKNMRDFQMQSNIDPDRINKIEAEIHTNRISAEDRITECNYLMRNMKLEMEKNLVKLEEYSNTKINIEKRLHLFNDNFMDVYRRVIKCQKEEVTMQEHIAKLLKDDAYAIDELKRINVVLLNIKISDDFQRMLSEMNPAKVLELQGAVDEVKSEQGGIFRQIALAKREIAIITAKSQNMGFLMPNKERQKLKKEEVYQSLNNFLIENQFAQKISNLDKQVNDYRNSMDSIALLSRQVARLQKESDYHKLSLEMKNLEEYFKKELAIISNRVKQRYNGSLHVQYSSFNDRPGSNRSSVNEQQPLDVPLARSFSTKKVNQINTLNLSKQGQPINRQLLQMKTHRNR